MKIAIVFLLTAVFIFPLYWMFVGAFQPIVGVMRMPPEIIPKRPTLENYRQIFKGGVPWRWILNTTMLVIGAALTSVLITGLAGTSLSMYPSRITKVIAGLLIGSILIPRYGLMISHFITAKLLMIHRTSLLVAAYPAIYYPVGTLLFKRYVDTIPRAFVDGARMDGAGEWRIVFKVIFPLCKPMFAVLLISGCIGLMQDYMWQWLTLQDVQDYTLAIGLLQIGSSIDPNYEWANPIGLFLATGTILFMPLLLIFVIFQKYFKGNLTFGGVKE